MIQLQQVIIKCPTCHKPLRVIHTKNEAQKACKCPLCGQRLLIRFSKASTGDHNQE